MKKTLSIILAVILCLGILWIPASGEKDNTITKVEVFTSVPSAGHRLDAIEVTVDNPSILEGLTAADFSLSGLSGKWGTTELHDFTVSIPSIAVNGNVLRINISNFTEKYFYVDSYTVTCAKNDALTFTMDDADATYTEIADEFEQVRMYDGEGNPTGASFDYNLYIPETTDKPMPLVLELHGSGDYLNLLQNRIATAWAEEQNQAERPCYVLAPLFQDGTTLSNEEVLQQSYQHIQKMIAEGKVDPNRVYVIGKSMGGGNCFTMLTRYNDIFAAGIVLCGYIDASLTEEEISRVKDTPVYVIYGEKDFLSTRTGQLFDKIIETGNTVSHERVYTEREMNNRGIASHHDVEIICMEDVSYMEWLFSQTKSRAGGNIQNIAVNTSVPSAGQRLDSIEITVDDAKLLEGLTADDFSLSGLCGKWGTTELHDFTVTISSIEVNGNVLKLNISNFYEKYLYVDSYKVLCSNPALNFSMADVDVTNTAVVDEFEQVRMYDEEGNPTGASFDYNLFTPAITDKPMPLVLELHGSGDYLNLLQNRIATAWAEEQNQTERPCYVLAPLFQDGTTLSNDEVLEQAYQHIKKMITEGKVDANRVYVIGKSMGGRNCFTMLTRYNDIFAAGIVLCGSVEASLTEEEISRVRNTPVYVIYGEKDNAGNKRGIVYDKIIETGNTLSHERVYTETEMNNRGIGGNHHDVEIICMEDISYMQWLFAQSVDKTVKTYYVDEAFSFDVTVNHDYAGVKLLNENDRPVGILSAKKVENSNGSFTWTISTKVGSAGENRKLRVLFKEGNEYKDLNVSTTFHTVVREKTEGDLAVIHSAHFKEAAVKVNQIVELTVQANSLTKKVQILSEAGRGIGKKLVASTPAGEDISYLYETAIGSTGERTFTILGAKADCVYNEAGAATASILVVQ